MFVEMAIGMASGLILLSILFYVFIKIGRKNEQESSY